jgi:hypothetical protein
VITPMIAPSRAPKIRPYNAISSAPINGSTQANRPKIQPISAPGSAPDNAPRQAAEAKVSRPVICSTDRRSRPTIATRSTGNPCVVSRSTARSASA